MQPVPLALSLCAEPTENIVIPATDHADLLFLQANAWHINALPKRQMMRGVNAVAIQTTITHVANASLVVNRLQASAFSVGVLAVEQSPT